MTAKDKPTPRELRKLLSALLERDEHRKKLNREKMRRYRASLKARRLAMCK